MLVFAAILATQLAGANEPWALSVVGGSTVASGKNTVELGLGLPSVASLAYRRGLSGHLDVGARVNFTFGVEGVPPGSFTSLPGQVIPVRSDRFWGGKAQALVKAKLAQSGALSIGLTIEPGVFVVILNFGSPTAPAVTVGGLSLPIEAKLGFATSDATTVGLSVGAPAWLGFGLLVVPVLAGIGIEHRLDDGHLLWARARAGPTFAVHPGPVYYDAGAGSGPPYSPGPVPLSADFQLGVAFAF